MKDPKPYGHAVAHDGMGSQPPIQDHGKDNHGMIWRPAGGIVVPKTWSYQASTSCLQETFTALDLTVSSTTDTTTASKTRLPMWTPAMTRLTTAIISSATSTKSKKPHSGNQTTMTVSATTITPTSSATESVFEAPSPKINLMIAVATRFTPTLETKTPTAIQLQSIPQLPITTESNQFQEGQVADSAPSLLSSALNFSSTPTTTSNPELVPVDQQYHSAPQNPLNYSYIPIIFVLALLLSVAVFLFLTMRKFWLPYGAAEAATGCKSLESQHAISIRNASVSSAAPHSWKYHARQSRVSSSGLICSGHLKLPSSTSHVTTLSLISVDE